MARYSRDVQEVVRVARELMGATDQAEIEFIRYLAGYEKSNFWKGTADTSTFVGWLQKFGFQTSRYTKGKAALDLFGAKVCLELGLPILKIVVQLPEEHPKAFVETVLRPQIEERGGPLSPRSVQTLVYNYKRDKRNKIKGSKRAKITPMEALKRENLDLREKLSAAEDTIKRLTKENNDLKKLIPKKRLLERALSQSSC